MHADELDTDVALVRRLLRDQFPQWAELELEPVLPRGTDNALYRLGDDMVVRLPRTPRTSRTLESERRWLPRLAPHLPLAVPRPLADGTPAGDYPFSWSVYTWLEGESATVAPVADLAQLAADLADFIAALQRIDPTDGPAPPPVWIHGDLDARNLLVTDDRLSGVVDWGAVGVGDPACEVMVAWKVLSAETRESFREALSVDDATWARARGWAVSQAVMALSHYTLETNEVLVREARRWLDETLAVEERTS
jgi:aminoglycoside phosphotransferase (APT) family kinase protein